MDARPAANRIFGWRSCPTPKADVLKSKLIVVIIRFRVVVQLGFPAYKLRLMAALVVGMEGVELGGLDLSRVRAVRS